MSRSKRHTPIMSWCVIRAGQVKRYKQQENRAYRRRVTNLMRIGKYLELPHRKEYGNEWSSPRDGKQYFGDGKNLDCNDARNSYSIMGNTYTFCSYIYRYNSTAKYSHYGCKFAYKIYMRK